MKCTGRQFMPNPLQGIWLEARCSRDALPEKRVCEVCEFSGLLGVIDGNVPDWVHMWGNKMISEEGVSDANMKIILTSSNIAHMFTDGIGLQNAPVESVRIREAKRKVIIKRKKETLVLPMEGGFRRGQVPPNEEGGFRGEQSSQPSSPAYFKNLQETFTRVQQQFAEMSGKKKEPVIPSTTITEKTRVIAKKKPIPLEFETATIIKSHAACIGIHYIESDMDTIEVTEIIYKKVKKEVVDLNGLEVICYNDRGAYYECGPNGEIKGNIELE